MGHIKRNCPENDNTRVNSGGTDGEDGPTTAAGAVADEPAITALVNRAPACGQVQKVQEIFARYGCAQGTCIVAPNLVRTPAIPPAAPAAAEAGAIERAAQDAR